MDYNKEDAIGGLGGTSSWARTPLLARQKWPVFEKHMETENDEGIGEECDQPDLQNVGMHCPCCDFFITQKMWRETSGSFYVRKDPTDEMLVSKASSSKTIQPAVVGKVKKEKGQEGSVLVEESMNGSGRAKVPNANKSQEVTVVDHIAERLKRDNNKKLDKEFNEVNVPEFYVFDNDKKEDIIRQDQVWAVYDKTGIPRLYAQIRKVFSPGFKVRVTWLVADPDYKHEIDWVDEGLPVSCGKFRLGRNEITEDRNMFSHSVKYFEGTSRGSLVIYPTKGETWALFKNWDIKRRCDPGKQWSYEYIYVKILSDYDEVSGIIVANLEKVKGSVSLCSSKNWLASYRISPKELYRFSHMVTSYRTTSYEKCSVPEGSSEFDPASVPTNLVGESDNYFGGLYRAKKFSTVAGDQSGAYLKDKAWYTKAKGFSSDVQGDQLEDQEGSASLEESSCNGEEASAVGEDQEESNTDDPVKSNPRYGTLPDPEFVEVADAEFYVFDNDRKEDCFERDQIWAIYDNVDAMPRFYARIKQVYSTGRFKVKIHWLAANPNDQDEIDWIIAGLPVSCGNFKLGQSEITEDINMFSHSVNYVKVAQRTLLIHPRKGETWALFKNWDIKWSSDPDNHQNYEYIFVKVLSDYNEVSGITVAHLEKVEGFVSLFSPKKGVASYRIPPKELYKLSHMIPSYRTTGCERVGVPEESFELDPAALPAVLAECDDNDFVRPHRAGGSSTVVGDKSEASLKEKALKTTEPDCFAADIKNHQINKRRGTTGFGESSHNCNVAADFCKTSGEDTAVGEMEDYKKKKCKTEENHHHEQNQPGPDRSTFWTACSFCKTKYQYYTDILNRVLRCQNCTRPFVASDLNVQSVPSSGSCMQPAIHQQK
ncbi:Dnaj subfamily b member [Thalictrum thalictroides]|uniref:Dnaj subfamily b member n=1 Tax=Thalictrum thalictroides TaxID=46969 RepID=A0A7J6X6C4_THATH|nr:Dnaj subfamily b member [Thalictrum thalictroides]